MPANLFLLQMANDADQTITVLTQIVEKYFTGGLKKKKPRTTK